MKEEIEEAKCEICKKSLLFQEQYPNGREDIEICIDSYEGEVEGKVFCSEKCFKEYVKKVFGNTQIGSKKETEMEGGWAKCEICSEEIEGYPSYSVEINKKLGDHISKRFCSDKCLRKFLKKYPK